MLDRYLALGRDAYSAGDPIAAEAFYQHAEHYHRMLRAEGGDDRGGSRQRGDQQSEASSAEDTGEPAAGELMEGSGQVSA